MGSVAARLTEAKKETIKAWKTACLLLASICIGLVVNNYQLRQTVPLWLPPDLASGQGVKAGVVDRSYAYFFAYTVFNGVHTWTKDGEKQFPDNIEMYSAYLGADYISQLTKDYTNRIDERGGKINELKGRTREVELLSPEKPSDMVRKVTNGSYVVYLDVYDTERVGGEIVKGGLYRLTLSVVRDTAAPTENDTGLKLLGQIAPPKLIN